METTQMTKRKKYDLTFRRDAVRRLETRADMPVAALAKTLGVTSSQLYQWQSQLGSQLGGAKVESAEEELKRLRKENARLLQEREILKKATAFFAKEGS